MSLCCSLLIGLYSKPEMSFDMSTGSIMPPYMFENSNNILNRLTGNETIYRLEIFHLMALTVAFWRKRICAYCCGLT